MTVFRSISAEGFANLFGTAVNDFSTDCLDFLQNTNFRYTLLNRKKRDRVILDIIRRLDDKSFSIAGKEAKKRWEKGWTENLDNFVKCNYDLSQLIPKYVRPNQVCRLYQEYISPESPNFEINFFTVLRQWLFHKFLSDAHSIYEFGCGTGYNLPVIAKLFPDRKIYGLDWSEAAVETVQLLGLKCYPNISGRLFDLFTPDYGLEISKGSAFLTIGCLEQLGDNTKPFIDFIRAKKPDICIHVEPIVELYDENNLVDYLAIRFHRTRNYLVNFLPQLQELEKTGHIELIKIQRIYFGSLFHDGWSLVIWKPTNLEREE